MQPFRIDRILTLYLFRHSLPILRGSSKLRIPILMYHSISEENGSPKTHPYYQTHTAPETFAAHMGYLYQNGYKVLDLREAVKLFTDGERGNAKYVALTFDDGFMDFYTKAFPVLQRYGFTATVFLPTAFIDKKGDGFKSKERLNWEEVRQLARKGITIGSHTVHHSQLWNLSQREIEYEIRHSKDTIEDQLEYSVESFSYPFAYPEDTDFKRYIRSLLEQSGYKNGVSTRIGTSGKWDDIYFLKRIPMNSADDPSFFQAKLEGGYDWLHTPQYLFKRAKRMITSLSPSGKGTG